ncbi:hypothetical protein [Arthrobacter alpinus]|uniref:hypothetical protein n=1 Tax=Arthrobacter alpinus TaxID=656366 RepID=UPI0012FCD116|nr:hypothetical protein [Arthrobacter alpinus]
MEIALLVFRFGVQMAVFGFYIGTSFAPNRNGMPVLEAGSRANALVHDACASNNIRFTETSLLQSSGIVVSYLNRVGFPRLTPLPARRCASTAKVLGAYAPASGRCG